MSYVCHYDSPLGGITVASDGACVCGLWFDGQKYFGSTLAGRSVRQTVPVLEKACRWLDLYFGGVVPDFVPPLLMESTPFRTAVWRAISDIPYGQTVSYAMLAANVALRLRVPRISARAVGAAVGRNPISIIVPCHRVIGSDGTLTGYAAGLDIKKALLGLERTVCENR